MSSAPLVILLQQKAKLGVQHKKCKNPVPNYALNYFRHASLTFNLDSLKSKKIQEELAKTTTS